MIWRTILKKIGIFWLKAGARALYNAVDKDKDGKLSREEILDALNYVKNIFRRIKNKTS